MLDKVGAFIAYAMHVAIVSLSCIPALAQPVYQWTDDRGVMQFSDVPPAGVKAQPVTIAPLPDAPPPTTDWRKLDEEFQARHRARQKALDEEIRARRLQAELDAIKQGRGTPVPGETFTEPGFQKRVLWALVSVDQAAAPECADHSVARTEVTGRDVDKQEIQERWVLDRCGEDVAYRLSFMPFDIAGGGGLEPMPLQAWQRPERRMHVVLDERASFTFERESSPQQH